MIPTQEEKRAKLREQLTKELLGSTTEKPTNKSPIAIRPKVSKKVKFLANPNNKYDPKKHSIQKMNACPNPKYREEKRESTISIAKVMGEKNDRRTIRS